MLKNGAGGLVVLLLAERARSECARSTRAIEDQPGYPWGENKRAWMDYLESWESLDARSWDHPSHHL